MSISGSARGTWVGVLGLFLLLLWVGGGTGSALQSPAAATGTGTGGVLAGAASDQAAGALASQAPAAGVAASVQGGVIRGSVRAGTVPLPGVSITATSTLTGKKYATSSDVTGAYAMTIPRNGRYVVRSELAGFAPATKEVLVNIAAGSEAAKAEQVAEFGLELASRVAQQEAAAQAGTQGIASQMARGLQALGVSTGDTATADASAGGSNAGVQMPTLGGLGGSDQAAATESVAVSGTMGQTNGLAGMNEDEVRQRVEDAMAQARAQGGGGRGDVVGALIGAFAGVLGGGGFGGPGGGRGGFGGSFRNFNPTQPHGAIFYQGGYGALNAIPFSLTGAPEQRQGNSQNRFGVSFTGSPYLPGLTKPNAKQFVFFNLTGARNINPLNLYAIVPTLAERAGDFSQFTQVVNGMPSYSPIYDPTTGLPFGGAGCLATPSVAGCNVIPGNRISAQARGLLNFYPAPNIPVTGNQNYDYQTITTAGQNSTQVSLRYVRNFGQTPAFGGARRQQASAAKTLRQNINFNGSYSDNASDNRSIFPQLGGASASTGYGVTAGYTIGFGRLTNNASVNWNRSHSNTYNYFTNSAANPAQLAQVNIGTPIVYTNSFYFGVPSLQFSGFSGLNNQAPSNTINQTISFSDFVSWSHKKHNTRFGVDVRRVHEDLIGGTNVLGGFTFSGYATEQPGAATTTKQVASGSSFADFLLGLPQQATVQASVNKLYLRENVVDWYAQDDYRVLANVTLNFGLRYEYFGPYTEKYNRLTNLDHSADFTQVALVLPGQKGSISGLSYPTSLVNPDHGLYSPRFGLAWRPKALQRTVIRAGYGINYNTSQFSRFAQRLSDQQPFAVTQTNIANQQGCGVLSLANAYNCSNAPVQSNFAVNPDYRLGHVQIYNLGVQRSLGLGIVLNVDYNGSKGGDLDIVRAPNRTALGLLNPSVQAFNYEDSLGFSRQNSMAVNARKRLQRGVSLGATYTYGHSIDDASSVNGSGNSVAQNDKNLRAEESNSSFDVRQRVTGNWLYELPFGPNRAFLAKGGRVSRVLDGFNISGDFGFATGSYFTPQYTATVAETATGSNNSLRPDRVFGQSISGGRTFRQWFNPAAFTAPANGFGTASRNSIEGPGTVSVNAALSRTISFGETRSFEARVSASNVLNTVQYSGINTTLNSQNFGQVTSTAQMRQLQFNARYRF